MNKETEELHPNVQVIEQEIQWLKTMIKFRRGQEAKRCGSYVYYEPTTEAELLPPDLTDVQGPYADLVCEMELDILARLLLITGLVVHLKPTFWEMNLVPRNQEAGFAAQWGLVRGNEFAGVLPTGLTWLSLMGMDPEPRLEGMQLLLHHPLSKSGIVVLEPPLRGEPHFSGRLWIPSEWVNSLLGVTQLSNL